MVANTEKKKNFLSPGTKHTRARGRDFQPKVMILQSHALDLRSETNSTFARNVEQIALWI